MKDTINNIFVEIDNLCNTYDAEVVAFLRIIYLKNFVLKHEIALSEILTIYKRKINIKQKKLSLEEKILIHER